MSRYRDQPVNAVQGKVAVCFENRMKHPNAESVEASGIYSNHWVLEGYSNAVTEYRTSPHMYFV
jgi:hypothetical protein